MNKIEKNPAAQNSSTVYGPVKSRRLGVSLGIDPIYQTSTCSFNCIYCQLGDIQLKTSEIKVYVEAQKVIQDLKEVLETSSKIEYITFSGSGEPTLAENLSEISNGIRSILPEVPQAILTNATTLDNPIVSSNLLNFEKVIVKIDACNEDEFKIVNRPVAGITLKNVLEGIKHFKSTYTGNIEVQMMLLPSNIKNINETANILSEIEPSLVQINAPKRPYPLSWHRENRGNHAEVFSYEVRKLKSMERQSVEKIVNDLIELTKLNFIIVD